MYESFKGSSDHMGDLIRYCVEHDTLTEYIQIKSIINFYKAGAEVKMIIQVTGKTEIEIIQLLKDNGIL